MSEPLKTTAEQPFSGHGFRRQDRRLEDTAATERRKSGRECSCGCYACGQDLEGTMSSVPQACAPHARGEHTKQGKRKTGSGAVSRDSPAGCSAERASDSFPTPVTPRVIPFRSQTGRYGPRTLPSPRNLFAGVQRRARDPHEHSRERGCYGMTAPPGVSPQGPLE